MNVLCDALAVCWRITNAFHLYYRLCIRFALLFYRSVILLCVEHSMFKLCLIANRLTMETFQQCLILVEVWSVIVTSLYMHINIIPSSGNFCLDSILLQPVKPQLFTMFLKTQSFFSNNHNLALRSNILKIIVRVDVVWLR